MKIKLNTLKLFIAMSAMVFATSCEETIENNKNTIDGVWECKETHSQSGENTYFVDIEYKNNDSSTIYIYNFLGLENDVKTNIHAEGKLKGNTIEIPSQMLKNVHRVKGEGVISSNRKTITWNYTHDDYDDGDPANVSAVYTLY